MQWKIQTKLPDSQEKESQYHPVLEALLKLREILSPEEQVVFLAPDYERDVHDPFLFREMEAVVKRVAQAKKEKEIVGIFGDFDADGVTSSVLLRTALDDLGVKNVVYIPDKITEGHGLNTKAVDFFQSEGANLIFTLDCGMMNHGEIEYARSKDIETIIVDHHHVPEVLPSAIYIINPKLKNEQYPFRDLCGAGTTFKVVQALYARLAPKKKEQLKWLLDIVAIGTVADVMPLLGENRTLVKYGLLVLSKTRNLGLRALLQVAKIDFEKSGAPDAELIAFQIAPRINAASRMAHAKIAHDLFMAKDEKTALSLAQELQELNTRRQKQSSALTTEIQDFFSTEKRGKNFLLASAAHYPYGIVGLVAGRLANVFQRPTAILTNEGETSRGSFRGIPGFSIIEALGACEDLLERYGGHEQAAGLVIRNERIPEFEKKFGDLVEAWLQKEGKQNEEKSLSIDVELLGAHITPETLREIKKLAPFGEGNREPVFTLQNVRISSVRFLGKKEEHAKLLFPAGVGEVDAIGFQLGEKCRDIQPGDSVHLAFTLGENIWNGRRSLQLKIIDVAKLV